MYEIIFCWRLWKDDDDDDEKKSRVVFSERYIRMTEKIKIKQNNENVCQAYTCVFYAYRKRIIDKLLK